jgi:hypothetical protein
VLGSFLLACAPTAEAPAEQAAWQAVDSGSFGDSGEAGADTEGLVLTDANNYQYSATLDAPTFSLAAESDNTLSWGDLSSDLLCHDIDPVADIDNVALLVFPYLSEEEVEAGFAADTLAQSDLGAYVSVEPGLQTSVLFSDFSFLGTEVDVPGEFTTDIGTCMVLLTEGTTIGTGVVTLAFVEPSEHTSTTSADITEGCGVLELDVELEALTPVEVDAEGPWPVRWTELSTTGIGNDFVSTEVSEVTLARYPFSPAELEGRFFDLEWLADEMWSADHKGGTSSDLGRLTTEKGDAFTEFEANSTYLLALRCGSCPTPAPLFLTVLEVGG